MLLCLEPIARSVTKADVLRFVEQHGGLQRRRVGTIEIRAGRATIEVPDGWQARLSRQLDGQSLGDRSVRAWVLTEAVPGDPTDAHFTRLAELLAEESRAEARQTAQRRQRLAGADAERTGLTLLDLVILDEDAGLGGRRLVRLGKRQRGRLPWTRLDVGSPVILSAPLERGEIATCRGVVFARDDSSLSVAFPGEVELEQPGDTWRLDVADDEIALQRQRLALQRARSAQGDRLAELRDVLLGAKEPEFHQTDVGQPLDKGLNEVQRSAVVFALQARDVALLHGPPGTGKTTTVVEVIRRAVRRGDKVLACAPSNLAVDNIFERLLAAGERAVRLGHPARVLPALREQTLDLLAERHPDVRLAHKYVQQAFALFRRAGRYTRARPEPGARQQTRQEARELLADARRLEAQAVQEILSRADVLCATTTGLDNEILGARHFDLAVIDESCQSVEPGCWIPLLRCDRVVLAGDHCQLPPTIISREAATGGLAVSLFERLVSLYGERITRRLEVQYRMHAAIMGFSSDEFYEGALVADDSVREHRLSDLGHVDERPATMAPLEFLDTAGAGYDEQQEADGESRRNLQEAELVVRKVHELLDAGVAPAEIAVITPYAAQVRLLRELLSDVPLEVDSVDGFQGREKEAIVISLVRSNPRGEIGFLADARRMNVAMTRARRRLLIIGDSATLSHDDFFRRLLEYVEQQGGYRTVWKEA